jgi:hypothetical protein
METLYDMNNPASQQSEEKDAPCANKTEANKKLHSSTFDMVPVLTATRMRKAIKEQIKDQFDKITG